MKTRMTENITIKDRKEIAKFVGERLSDMNRTKNVQLLGVPVQ